MVSTVKEYRDRMNRIHSFLGGKCVKCGTNENLHVDHINHLDKSFSIGNNWSRSWDVLEPELLKCQLLCETHHLEKSLAEGSLAKGWTNEKRSICGTVWQYSRYGCRCDLCKKAKSDEYQRLKLKRNLKGS